MKVVILAGGLGTRLTEETETGPTVGGWSNLYLTHVKVDL